VEGWGAERKLKYTHVIINFEVAVCVVGVHSHFRCIRIFEDVY